MLREQIQILGQSARDRVTGFAGTVTSVSFDLYGCVMAVVTPRVVDGKRVDGEWFDVKRLEVTGLRVMDAPSFDGRPGDETGPELHPPLPSSPLR